MRVTEIPSLVPVMEAVVVSVAVTVWRPSVLRVTENVPVPATRAKLVGRVAAVSLLVMATVPV